MIKNRNVVSVKVMNYSLSVIRSRMLKNRRRASAKSRARPGSGLSMDIGTSGIIRKMYTLSERVQTSNAPSLLQEYYLSNSDPQIT